MAVIIDNLHIYEIQSIVLNVSNLLQIAEISSWSCLLSSLSDMLLLEAPRDSDDSDTPPAKKSKLQEGDLQLEAVLAPEVRLPVPLVPVLAATVKNRKVTSLLVKLLNQHFPADKLQHLKRVNSSSTENSSIAKFHGKNFV